MCNQIVNTSNCWEQLLENLPGSLTLPCKSAALSLQSSAFEQRSRRVGAAIFRQGKIVGLGYNMRKGHPLCTSIFKHATIHAEVKAILDTDNLEKTGEIFVVRFSATGKPVMSKPCPMCTLLLNKFNVQTAYYTTDIYPYWSSCDIEEEALSINKQEVYLTNGKTVK